jgi:hypothetical protein
MPEHFAHEIRAAEKRRADDRPDLTQALAEAARVSGAPEYLMVTTTAGVFRALAWGLRDEVAYSGRLVEQATDNAERAAQQGHAETAVRADRDRLAGQLYDKIERLQQRLAAAEAGDTDEQVALLRRYADDLEHDRDGARDAEQRAYDRLRQAEQSRDHWVAIARNAGADLDDTRNLLGPDVLTQAAEAEAAQCRLRLAEVERILLATRNLLSGLVSAVRLAGKLPPVSKLSWEQVQALDYAFGRHGADLASVVDTPHVGPKAVEAIAEAARRQRVMVAARPPEPASSQREHQGEGS